jgi:hypothetical protein
MGAAAGAAGTSIAGAGLGAYAQILSAQGTAAGMNYEASALENAAARGKVAAAPPRFVPGALLGLFEGTRRALMGGENVRYRSKSGRDSGKARRPVVTHLRHAA